MAAVFNFLVELHILVYIFGTCTSCFGGVPVYTKARGYCVGHDIGPTNAGNCSRNGNTFISCKKQCDNNSQCVSFMFGHYVVSGLDIKGWCCLMDYQCNETQLQRIQDPIYTYGKNSSLHSCDIFFPLKTCVKTCRLTCPPNCTEGIIYGDVNYSDDSDVCTAAIHAGATSPSGGIVNVRRTGTQVVFNTKTRNGITSVRSGAWKDSFTFDCSHAPPKPDNMCGHSCDNITADSTYCDWSCKEGFRSNASFYCQHGIWRRSDPVPACVECEMIACGRNCTSTCVAKCKVCDRITCDCKLCLPGIGGSACDQDVPTPNQFVISNKTAHSFHMTWPQCDGNQSIIDGYQIHVLGKIPMIYNWSSHSNRSTTIDGLTKGTTYFVSMSCMYRLELTIERPPRTNETAITTCGNPDIPGLFLSTSRQNDNNTKAEIRVNFEQPIANCYTITHQTIHYKLFDGGEEMSAPTGHNNTAIPNLIPYTTYLVALQVFNNVDLSTKGLWTRIKTAEGVPPKMMAPSIDATTLQSITISISKPEPPHGVIIQYRVRLDHNTSDSTGTLYRVIAYGGVNTAYTVKMFIEGVRKYTMKVQAFTSVGGGEWSESVDVEQKNIVPPIVKSEATCIDIRTHSAMMIPVTMAINVLVVVQGV